jgi:hypothetical protein
MRLHPGQDEHQAYAGCNQAIADCPFGNVRAIPYGEDRGVEKVRQQKSLGGTDGARVEAPEGDHAAGAREAATALCHGVHWLSPLRTPSVEGAAAELDPFIR